MSYRQTDRKTNRQSGAEETKIEKEIRLDALQKIKKIEVRNTPSTKLSTT